MCLSSLRRAVIFFGLLLTFQVPAQGQQNIPEWPKYITGLDYYHSYHPNVFRTADMVRWDRIDPTWLKAHIQKWGRVWENLWQQRLKMDEAHPKRLKVSRLMNQELYDYISEKEKKSDINTHLHGSTTALLSQIPDELRRAFTPLDAKFQQTDLGKKIFQKLSQATRENFKEFLLYTKANSIYLKSDSPELYKIRFRGEESAEISVDVYGPDKVLLTPSLTMQNQYLNGLWLNSKSNTRYPLGKYPATSEQFVIEGHQHFHGDGHKH